MKLKKMLTDTSWVPAVKSLMQEIGIHEALILCELINQHDFYAERNELTTDKMFFCTIEKMQAEIPLTKFQQSAVFFNLEKLELLRTKKIGSPPKRYIYLVQENIEKLLLLLKSKESELSKVNKLDFQKSINLTNESKESELSKVNKLDTSKIIDIRIEDKSKLQEESKSENLQFSHTPASLENLELSKKIESLNLEIELLKLKEEANKKPSKGRADALNKSVIKEKKKTATEILLALKPESWEPDSELLELWEIINAEKTWKDKSEHTLTLRVKDLFKFDMLFSKDLLKQAIKGGAKGVWQGFVFKETQEKYEAWKWAKQHGGTPQAAPKKENPRNDFAKFYK